MNSPTLVITRGLPGAGKATFARRWVDEDLEKRIRVNYRDLYTSMYGRSRPPREPQKNSVRKAQHAQVQALLLSGISVVVDDENLVLRDARAFADLALRTGAEFQVRDFTDVSLSECIQRDAGRVFSVGEQTIRDLYRRYKFPLPKVEPTPRRAGERPAWYKPHDTSAIPTVIVDLDGTLARNITNREMWGPRFEERVYEDEVNQSVLRFITGWLMQGYELIFMSGRAEISRAETMRWLFDKAGIREDEYELFMRRNGDGRHDYEVKADLFEEHVRPYYANVALAIDDRNQVVDLWRGIGLECWQVRDGDF